jgi:hypothetical protein
MPLHETSTDSETAYLYFLANGWREYPDQLREYARCYYKRFDTPTRCACNDDKVGVQICVAVSKYKDQCSYEIDLCGQLADGTWVKFQNYAMPDNLEEGLAKIPRLLSTWEAIAASASEEQTKNNSEP